MDIQQLKEAGFSDDEIQSYSVSHPEMAEPKSMAIPTEQPTSLSLSLKDAGFSDQEIGEYQERTGALPIEKQPPPELPSRSVLESILPAFGRGGAQLIKQLGQAGKALPIGLEESVFEPMIEKGEKLMEKPALLPSKESQTGPRRWLEQGLEQVGPSVGPQAMGAGLGFLIGGPPGAAVGWLAGGQVTPVIFGLSQYQDTIDTARKQAQEKGLDPDKAEKNIKLYAVASGTIEWLGEAAANYLEAKLFGVGGEVKHVLTEPLKRSLKGILTPTLKQTSKNMIKTFGIEALTEAFQGGGETYVEKLGGIEREQSPLEAAVDAIGPTLVMTAIFGIGATSVARSERRQLLEAIRDPGSRNRLDATRQIRQGLIDQAESIEAKDPETAQQYRQLSDQWDAMTRDAINRKQPIELDQTIAEATEEYRKPEAKEEQKPEAIPISKMEEPKAKTEEVLPIEALGLPTSKPEIQGQVKTETEAIPPTPTPPPTPAPELTLPVQKVNIPEIKGLEYKGIQKIPGQPDQYVFTDTKTRDTFYTTDLSEQNLIANRDRIRTTFKEAEVAKQAKALPVEKLRYIGEIHELRSIVEIGEPGKRVGTETGETAAWGSSYPNFMKNKGWTRDEVLTAIDKGIAGQTLGPKQYEIWQSVKNEARGIFKNRITEQKKVRPKAIPTGDLEIGDKIRVAGEVLTVTQKDNEKIVIKDGQKFELDPYFATIEGRKIEGKEIPKEAIPAKGITLKELFGSGRKEITEEELSQLPDVVSGSRSADEMRSYLETKGITVAPKKITPELSPTEKEQYKLPGVKIGIEGKKPIEEGPTLEGTPLAEAAKKEEIAKVQQALPIETTERQKIGETILKERIQQDVAEAEKRAEEVMPILGKKLSEVKEIGNWEKGEDRPFAFDPNSTENQGRFRLKDPDTFDEKGMGESKFITRFKKNGIREPGMSFIVGKINGQEEVQAIRFDKDYFTEDKARQWWNENAEKFGRKAIEETARLKLPGFYSPLQKVIEEKMGNAMPVKQLKDFLKQPGIKADETKWTGLDDFLASKEGKITKQEVLDFLEKNEVNVEEVTKGAADLSESFKEIERIVRKYDRDWAEEIEILKEDPDKRKVDESITNFSIEYYDKMSDADIDKLDQLSTLTYERRDTKFSQWQLPGGENYRELLLTLPEKGVLDPAELVETAKRYAELSGEEWESLGPNGRQGFENQARIDLKKKGPDYRSPHFGEPNVLAHVRFNDRVDAQGKKVLFIEEVQSDWHQAGRERGYKGSKTPTDEEIIEYFGLREGANPADYRNEMIERKGGVPPAPFSKTWHELTMKRMVRWASENGFDKIAWTTGEQQAERYDLSKQLSAVNSTRLENGNYHLLLFDKEGRDITESIPQLPYEIIPTKLSDYVGKDLAEKIINNKESFKNWSGLDLKVGGEGMKGFYDKILPEYMNKFGKKWGAKVGETKIEAGMSRPVYTGPTKTIEEVKEFTKEKYDVSTNQAARNIIKIMAVEDFKTAMEKYGSYSFAQKMGGQLLRSPKAELVHSIEITPAMKESVLKEGLPMFKAGEQKTRVPERFAPVTPEDINQITERIKQILPEHTSIDFVEEVWVNTTDPKFKKSLNEWMKEGKANVTLPGFVRMAGVTRQWNTSALGFISMIEVGTKGFRRGDVVDTAYHEAWHAVRSFLDKNQIELLSKKYATEEKEAIAFAKFATGKETMIPVSVRSIFAKIRTFFEAFGNYLKSKGFQSVESIFGRAYEGMLPGQTRELRETRKQAGVWKEGRRPEELGGEDFMLNINVVPPSTGFKKKEGIGPFKSRIEAQRLADLRNSRGKNDMVYEITAGEYVVAPIEEKGQLKIILPGGIRDAKSENPEVEKRMGEAYGLDQTSHIEKFKSQVFKVLHSFTRHFEHLPSKRFGKVIDILRRFEQVPEFAKKEASDRLKEIVGGLNKGQLNIFSRSLILNDLVKDYESGLYDHSKSLPFGYRNIDEVQTDLGKFEAIAKANKSIREALDKRQQIWDDLREELIDKEILPEAVKADDRYFHHQVLQYMAIKNYYPGLIERKQYTGLSPKEVRLHKKGWQIAREGSALDFNTNYLESEFEVFSQAVAQIETIKTLDRIQEAEDISGDLKDKARDAGKSAKEWKEFIPEGYTTWQPKKGFNFYMANTITDKFLEKLLGPEQFAEYEATGKIRIPGIGLAEVDEMSIRKALAVGKRKAEWCIPIELQKTMDAFRDFKDEGPLFKGAQAVLSSWKQWILLNPIRVVKYNLNNLSGDADIVFAYNHRILTQYGYQAMRDLYAQLRGKSIPGKLSEELREASRSGVIGSGISIHEIPDISKQGVFKILTGDNHNALTKYWTTVKDYTNFRENVLRLAAYRFFKDEIKKGSKVYGASKVSEVDAIKDPNERAAKLARELIGDYGNISKAGQWIRSNIIPFYSWMEINAPRYVRLIQNLKQEGKRGQIVGLGAIKIGKLGVKMLLMYGLISLWNATFFPDEEEELGRTAKRQLHLILGRRSDGSIRSLRFQGALSDALSWFALEDFPQDFKEVMSGKVSWTKKLEEALLAGPERLFQGARPIEKAIGEVLTGKALYPDIRKPRPIRDRAEHILRTVSLDMPYKYLAGKPTRGMTKELEGMLTYRTDPGEAAYYDIINKARDFLEEQGYEVPSFTPTEKSNILYYYKQAQKLGDRKAAQKYMDKYIELGGTKGDLMKSINKSHPMAMVPTAYRKMFMQTLDEEDRKSLEQAVHWWQSLYGGS